MTKTEILDGFIYTLSNDTRFKKGDVLLSLVDDESYGDEFVYDGGFDEKSDLEFAYLFEDTYLIVSKSKQVIDEKEINKMLSSVFIINRCDFTLEQFFKSQFQNSIVEDGCILHFNGSSFEIEKFTPVGMDVQRDLEFYILTTYTE